MVSNFEHCPILSKHAVCNELNKFTKFEYYKHEDVKYCFKKILSVISDDPIRISIDEFGKEVWSTNHKEIKKYIGNKLISQTNGTGKVEG